MNFDSTIQPKYKNYILNQKVQDALILSLENCCSCKIANVIFFSFLMGGLFFVLAFAWQIHFELSRELFP